MLAAANASAAAPPFELACPGCRGRLALRDGDAVCDACGAAFERRDGIWRCLLPERSRAVAQFVHEYGVVRRAEGWGAEDAAYYRALPWRDLSGRFAELWRVRARTFETFVTHVVEPLERSLGRPVRSLELGAGNCWLAYRLARRGHLVAAVDLATDRFDGLGAHVHYDAPVLPIQADFDHLPLASGQADLVVFDASLHYSTDYARTLGEALRVLRPDGRLAILDSPLYRDPTSGARMVREREARFEQTYGFRSDALPSEHFLTPARLDQLASELGVRWEVHVPFVGWRWAVGRWLAAARARREPARFGVIVGVRAR